MRSSMILSVAATFLTLVTSWGFVEEVHLPTPGEWVAPRLKLHDIELRGTLAYSNAQIPEFRWHFELLEKRERGVLKYRSISIFAKETKLVLAQITTPDRVITYSPTGRRITGAIFNSPTDGMGLLRIYGPRYEDPQNARLKKDLANVERPADLIEALKQLPARDPRLYDDHFGEAPTILAASLGFEVGPPLQRSGDLTSAVVIRNGKLTEKRSDGVLDIATPLAHQNGSALEPFSMKRTFLLDASKDFFPLEIQRITLPEEGDFPSSRRLKPHVTFVRSEPKSYRDEQGNVVWYPRKCVWGGVEADKEGKPIGEARHPATIEIESAKFNHEIPLSKFDYSALPISVFPVRVDVRSDDVDLAAELPSDRFVLNGSVLVGVKATP